MTPDFKQSSIADSVLSLHRRLVAAKHVRKVGPAIWVLLTLLDQRTGPRGEVDHGDPVQLRDLAGRLDRSEQSVSDHLHRLERNGYVRLDRTNAGYRITLVERLWTEIPVGETCTNVPITKGSDPKKRTGLTVITNKGRGETSGSKQASVVDPSPSSTDPISKKARLVAELQGLPPRQADTSSWRDGAARLADVEDSLIRACLADADLWRDRQSRAIPPGYVADRLPRWLASRPQPQLRAEDWQALRQQGLFEEGKRLFEAHDVDGLHRLCERAWEEAE